MKDKSKNNLFSETSNKAAHASPGDDNGFINKKANSSMTLKKDGQITLNAGIYAQIKCDKDTGVNTEHALQSVTNTVQRELNTNDLIINRHKFNTQLIEFTNLKYNMGTVMGDLGMHASVLVKAWEPTLQQFVLIRRPARFPVFGHLLDAYVIDNRLEVEDKTDELLDILRNLNNFDADEEEGEDE